MEHPNIRGHNGFVIEFFPQDFLGANTVGKGVLWEPHILAFINREESRLRHIIDVGANLGYHTLAFSRVVGEEGRVFAFEPQPQNFQLLERNVHIHNGLKNVDAYHIGCAREPTTAMIPLMNLDDRTPTNPHINMGDFTLSLDGHTSPSYANVACMPLDAFDFPAIDLIKIDVQGMEVDVLEGARQLMARDRPTIIIELESHQLQKMGKTCGDVVDLLRSMEYEVYYLDYEYPSDHVCVHKDRVRDFEERFRDVIFPHTTTNEINHNVELGIHKKIVLL